MCWPNRLVQGNPIVSGYGQGRLADGKDDNYGESEDPKESGDGEENDKASVLEANSGGFLQGPPQATETNKYIRPTIEMEDTHHQSSISDATKELLEPTNSSGCHRFNRLVQGNPLVSGHGHGRIADSLRRETTRFSTGDCLSQV